MLLPVPPPPLLLALQLLMLQEGQQLHLAPSSVLLLGHLFGSLPERRDHKRDKHGVDGDDCKHSAGDRAGPARDYAAARQPLENEVQTTAVNDEEH